jgi:hypothetical protein
LILGPLYVDHLPAGIGLVAVLVVVKPRTALGVTGFLGLGIGIIGQIPLRVLGMAVLLMRQGRASQETQKQGGHGNESLSHGFLQAWLGTQLPEH